MINETINGQVQYEGDSSEIDLHAYDEAVKAKMAELRAEVSEAKNIDMLMDILLLDSDDELREPLLYFVKCAPCIIVLEWLCKDEMDSKFEDYIEKNYNYNHITNELWR